MQKLKLAHCKLYLLNGSPSSERSSNSEMMKNVIEKIEEVKEDILHRVDEIFSKTDPIKNVNQNKTEDDNNKKIEQNQTQDAEEQGKK